MIEYKGLKISEITLGIRHKRNFSILDKFGEIIDDMVDNSKFPKGYFDEISTDGFTKVVSNSITKNYIKLTQFDLIYRHKVTKDDNEENELNLFWERVNNYIVPSVIDKYNIRDFSRIGIVYSFEFDDKNFYSKCLENIINNKFSNINSIRFSEKDLTAEGRLFKETEDYINKLYSLAITNDIAMFSYDYQYYFKPLKSIFKQCEIDKVIEKSKKALGKDILKIIGENSEEKEQ